MSEYVHLEVYFRTDNPLPEQELRGIFDRYLPGWATVRRMDGHEHHYTASIAGLFLHEASPALQRVKDHCSKNNRLLSLTITHAHI